MPVKLFYGELQRVVIGVADIAQVSETAEYCG